MIAYRIIQGFGGWVCCTGSIDDVLRNKCGLSGGRRLALAVLLGFIPGLYVMLHMYILVFRGRAE